LRSSLAELAPLVRVFVPGLSMGGELELYVEPLRLTVGDLDAPATLAPRLRLALAKGAVGLGDLQAQGVELQLGAWAESTQGSAELAAQIPLLRAAGQRLEGLSLALQATSPLEPWIS